MSVIWTGIALRSWLTPAVVITVITACMVAGLRLALPALAQIPHRFKQEVYWWRSQDLLIKTLVFASLILLSLLGCAAFLTPPIGDAEAFYITYPKIIADSQRFIPMPGLYATFSQIGLVGELHFAALMQIGDVRTAKLFVWPVSIAAGLMLMALAARLGCGRRGQWFALLILLTSTSFTNYVYDGKVDNFAAALGITAAYWALRCGENDRPNFSVALTGLLAGFASLAKFSYLAALLPFVFLLIWWQLPNEPSSPRNSQFALKARACFIFAVCVGLSWIPQLVKNSLLFGNSFAPFIGAPEASSIIDQVWFSPEITRRIVLTYPLALVFGRYPMQGGNLSFLLLAFLPLALFIPRPKAMLRSPLVQVTVIALMGTLVWVALRPSLIAPRYILATLLLFVPLAARAVEYAYDNEQSPHWLRFGIVATCLGAALIFSYPLRKIPVALAQYAQGTLAACALASIYCAPLNEINAKASPGDRIYFANYYGYWLRSDLLECRDDRTDGSILSQILDGEPFWNVLAERGFRYVIIDKTSHAAVLKRLGEKAGPNWIELKTFSENPDVVIYHLEPTAAPVQPAVECRQISPPAWDVVSR